MIWLLLLAGAGLAYTVSEGQERRAALWIALGVLTVQLWKAPTFTDDFRWLLFFATWLVVAGSIARHLDTRRFSLFACAMLTLLSAMCYAAGAGWGLHFGVLGSRFASPLFYSDLALALAIASAGGRNVCIVGVASVRRMGGAAFRRAVDFGAARVDTAETTGPMVAATSPIRGRDVR